MISLSDKIKHIKGNFNSILPLVIVFDYYDGAERGLFLHKQLGYCKFSMIAESRSHFFRAFKVSQLKDFDENYVNMLLKTSEINGSNKFIIPNKSSFEFSILKTEVQHCKVLLEYISIATFTLNCIAIVKMSTFRDFSSLDGSIDSFNHIHGVFKQNKKDVIFL